MHLDIGVKEEGLGKTSEGNEKSHHSTIILFSFWMKVTQGFLIISS
jgi:hypothetical protein